MGSNAFHVTVEHLEVMEKKSPEREGNGKIKKSEEIEIIEKKWEKSRT